MAFLNFSLCSTQFRVFMFKKKCFHYSFTLISVLYRCPKNIYTTATYIWSKPLILLCFLCVQNEHKSQGSIKIIDSAMLRSIFFYYYYYFICSTYMLRFFMLAFVQSQNIKSILNDEKCRGNYWLNYLNIGPKTYYSWNTILH